MTMNAAFEGEKRRWVIATIGAMLIMAVVLFLFRGPQAITIRPMRPTPVSAPQAKPVVQLANTAAADPVLADELLLRDMRPLFLPTEGLNVALPEPRREPGKTFLDNETVKWSFSETDLNIGAGLPQLATINGKPADAANSLDVLASDAAGPALQGFGRREPEVAPMEVRGGFVEVVAATGHHVWAEPLPPDARPPGNKPWQPIEFVASVDAAGLTAPLVVTTSSQLEEVDTHYRNFLARRYRIGDRLPPGFYRITVGP
jgi:hypothetical protein